MADWAVVFLLYRATKAMVARSCVFYACSFPKLGLTLGMTGHRPILLSARFHGGRLRAAIKIERARKMRKEFNA